METVKIMETKDGNKRVRIFNDDYAENPREMTDEPLHCNDWSREFSIMTKDERAYRQSDARSLICHFLLIYGETDKMLSVLFDNGKHIDDINGLWNNALVYDRSYKCWNLMCYRPHVNIETGKREIGWCVEDNYGCRRDELDLEEILDEVTDETIDYFAKNFLTDKVKAAGYSFGYHGSLNFYDTFSTSSEGIAWLEKDEFLKYSGNGEEYWNGKTLREIEWLLGELTAWSDDEVYGFKVEEKVVYETTRHCLSGNAEDEKYEETEWIEEDSCYGFYGKVDKVLPWMLENTSLNCEELVAV